MAALVIRLPISYLCFHLATANASTATGYAISRGYGYVGERNGTVIRTSRFASPPSYWGQLIVKDGLYRLFDQLDKGTIIPAIGIPLISLGLASRDNERR